MKDNFSVESNNYFKYRPKYPLDFLIYLNSLVQTKLCSWDCGTGNGQVAFELAKTFDNVFATDISQSQLDNALQASNIKYSLQAAEKVNFEDNKFDLIVIAQAIHWFDFDKFYTEVKRTAKENALICVLGYGKIEISEAIDCIITDFYSHTIGVYWDKERRYIDENYTTIPFPFEEIKTPTFNNKLNWSFEHLIGYVNTWSAVKHFTKKNGYNPIEKLQDQIEKYWKKGELKTVSFPLLLRIGKIMK